jgi:hypothetical protein
MYYDDINPEILEQSGPLDAYIVGFCLGILVILLLLNKHIFTNESDNNLPS